MYTSTLYTMNRGKHQCITSKRKLVENIYKEIKKKKKLLSKVYSNKMNEHI